MSADDAYGYDREHTGGPGESGPDELVFLSEPISDSVIVSPGYHAVTFIDTNGSVSYRVVVHGGTVEDPPDLTNVDHFWKTIRNGVPIELHEYGPIISDVVFNESANRNHSGGSN